MLRNPARLGVIGALVGTLALGAAAQAQETQRAQPSDTAAQQQAGADAGQDSTTWGRQTDPNAEVQNPPGYRGMERPVNVFPKDTSDSAGGEMQDTTAEAVQERVTGEYQGQQGDSGAQQNPPGYRGMERPAELEAEQAGGDTGAVQQQTHPRKDKSKKQGGQGADSAHGQHDTTEQNPEGYRGMERERSVAPETQQEPVDTFLQQQGTDPRADTAGLGGLEQPDTTGVNQGDEDQSEKQGAGQNPGGTGSESETGAGASGRGSGQRSQ